MKSPSEDGDNGAEGNHDDKEGDTKGGEREHLDSRFVVSPPLRLSDDLAQALV